MKRYFAAGLLLFALGLTLTAGARADTIFNLNLPGIVNGADQIPIVSFVFADAHHLEVTHFLDQFSPALHDAVSTGKSFAAGSLDTFDTAVSTTTPIMSVEMTEIVVTSAQVIRDPVEELPRERITFVFSKGTVVNRTVPAPESGSGTLLGVGLLGLALLAGRRVHTI